MSFFKSFFPRNNKNIFVSFSRKNNMWSGFLASGFFALQFFLGGCGAFLNDSDTEAETAYINTALSLITQALNLKEAVEPFSAHQIFSRLLTDACSVAGGGITASSCASGGRQSYTYNNCAGQFTGGIYTGNIDLDFSASCSFSLNPGQDVLVTSTNFKTTLPDESLVMWSSGQHNNYVNTTVSGGYRIANDSSNITLMPIGMRKLYLGQGGAIIFDHTIRAQSNVGELSISPSFADGTRSVSGQMIVDSNSSQFTANISFVGVIFGSNSCGHPTVGTVDVSFSGTKSGTQSFAFNGSCGLIEDSDTGISYTLDLPI